MHTLLFLALSAACAPQEGSISVDAGPSVVGTQDDTYIFDGSDTEGEGLRLSWRLTEVPEGSELGPDDLIDADTARAVLVPDVAGRYELSLEACDAFGQCSESGTWAWATENAETRVAVPVANAGNSMGVSLGTVVNLSGNGSGVGPLSYLWSAPVRPSCSWMVNSDIQRRTTNSASALPDCEGTFSFRLRVTDGAGISATDLVTYVVGPGNAPPRAIGAPSTTSAVLGDTITLDGTQSYDPSGDPITYRWAFYNKPANSSLTNSSISNRTSATASFVPDVAGNYTLKLIVSDGLNADVAVLTRVSLVDDDWPD